MGWYPSRALVLTASLLPFLLRASAPTMALPRTLGELQLYRVLQRANLLSYYETFIQQGGDDVQQLCEAGEEEFLEIMALVGMATKPLHVRRLQKALREWATNPGLFSQPVPAVPVSSIPLFKISETAGTRKGSMSNGHGSPGEKAGSARSFSPKSPLELGEKLSPLPGGPGAGDPRIWPGQSTPESDVGAGGEEEAGSPPFSPPAGGGVPEGTGAGGVAAGGAGGGPDRLEPEMVRMVVESVERIFRSFPRGDTGEITSLLKLNKKLARSVGHIFEMDDNDSQKEEEIRKYSIIYGRLDSKRREGKQLSLHEVRTRVLRTALPSWGSRSLASETSSIFHLCITVPLTTQVPSTHPHIPNPSWRFTSINQRESYDSSNEPRAAHILGTGSLGRESPHPCL